LAGGSVVAALVGIEDDAEWQIDTDEYCSWAAMVDVVMGMRQRWTLSAICFLLLLEYDQIVITIKFVNFRAFFEKSTLQSDFDRMVNGKRFRSPNFERPEKSSGPTDRAETLCFALNTLKV
jgi:hypothetical protein